MTTAIEKLTQLLPQKVLTDSESLKKYAKDWTTYFDIKSSAIVFPESTDDVVLIVKWARQNKIALIPSGGRTGLSGGACATTGEIVVNFERMNKIFDFSNLDSTVKVEAGVITENLQRFAAENNLYYPVDFAARGSSQIGGNIATNAGGIKVVRYGLTRDWVMGLKVVTGAGEVLELNKGIVKNATGYDFRHLFIGSEGTLGFITEATIRLTNPPPHLKVFMLGLSQLDNAMEVFAEFKKSVTLTAFEMFSELALQKVTASTQLPRPFETKCPFYILAEIECPTEEQESKAILSFEKCMENGWLQDGSLSQSDVQVKNFWRLREDISESLSKFNPYKNDISVKISLVPDFIKDLDVILQKSYPTWEVVWFGHIGDGNLHINILRPSELSKEDFVKECQKVDQMVFQVIKKFNGSISAEHGVGLTKKPFLSFTRSPAELQLMKSIKLIFDPDQIINPGKLIDI